MCKDVHPFLSQHLVRVLTEDAVEALADDEKMVLGPHLYPHNQVQAFLAADTSLREWLGKEHVRQECVEELAR